MFIRSELCSTFGLFRAQLLTYRGNNNTVKLCQTCFQDEVILPSGNH